MTEMDWLDCTDPMAMLASLPRKASARKRRLLGCAFCRRAWQHLRKSSRNVVDLSERYADKQVRASELAAAVRPLDEEASLMLPELFLQEKRYVARDAAAAARMVAARDCTIHALTEVAALSRRGAAQILKEMEIQCHLVRDIFNPFQPATTDPTCERAVVKRLAKSIYEDRGFDQLPILADALEEAGCADAAILEHCRGREPHVRGCWVIDRILGHS